jgi:hypothetical protein
MIELGSLVQETISGLKGIAVARSEWITGCVRYGLDIQKVKEDGTLYDTYWIDEARLKVLKPPKEGILTKKDPHEGGTSNPKLPNGR